MVHPFDNHSTHSNYMYIHYVYWVIECLFHPFLIVFCIEIFIYTCNTYTNTNWLKTKHKTHYYDPVIDFYLIHSYFSIQFSSVFSMHLIFQINRFFKWKLWLIYSFIQIHIKINKARSSTLVIIIGICEMKFKCKKYICACMTPRILIFCQFEC